MEGRTANRADSVVWEPRDKLSSVTISPSSPDIVYSKDTESTYLVHGYVCLAFTLKLPSQTLSSFPYPGFPSQVHPAFSDASNTGISTFPESSQLILSPNFLVRIIVITDILKYKTNI